MEARRIEKMESRSDLYSSARKVEEKGSYSDLYSGIRRVETNSDLGFYPNLDSQEEKNRYLSGVEYLDAIQSKRQSTATPSTYAAEPWGGWARRKGDSLKNGHRGPRR